MIKSVNNTGPNSNSFDNDELFVKTTNEQFNDIVENNISSENILFIVEEDENEL